MSVIDTTYFYGPLSIAQISQTEIAAEVQMFIDENENSLLSILMGYELSKAYLDGISAGSPAQKWLDIRDGKEYTDSNGNLTKWLGLRFTVGTSKHSLIANYVYCKYIEDSITITTASGEKKTDLAVNVSPVHKMVKAWNEMIKQNIELYLFLSHSIATYPEFENVVLDTYYFTYKNSLGI